jgi:hypothetical protein
MSDDRKSWTEAEQALLQARAARLLGSVRHVGVSPQPSVVVVSTAGREVALPESAVLGVRRLRELTVVHGAPPSLLGVFAFGELVLPAFQLASLLGLPPRPSERPFVLLLGRTGPELGVEVDKVVGADVCLPEPPLTEPMELAFCGRTPSGAPVLDVDALFVAPSLAVS